MNIAEKGFRIVFAGIVILVTGAGLLWLIRLLLAYNHGEIQ